MRKRLLSLYPEAWRERYGEEMCALIDESPPSVATILDLLRGALAAHLRPLGTSVPAARARGTITYVLGCFIVFCFARVPQLIGDLSAAIRRIPCVYGVF